MFASTGTRSPAERVGLGLVRAGYRAAWWLLWLSGLLHRGHGRGAKAILVHDGRVLLVRHTYGRRCWELPGGGLRRGETPLEGVRREIREELGVALVDARLVAVGSAGSRHPRRRVSLFTATLEDAALAPDAHEIARAEWFSPEALPTPLGWQVAQAVAALRLGGEEPPAALA